MAFRKFGNRPRGIYDSRLEERFHRLFPGLEREALKLPAVLIRSYWPDFYDRKTKTIYEIKGQYVPEAASKIAAALSQIWDGSVSKFVLVLNKNAGKSRELWTAWLGRLAKKISDKIETEVKLV